MDHTPSSVAIATALRYDDELLVTLVLPTGKLQILRGVGSGLTRRVDDPAGTFWAVGDRGPNIKIKVAVARFGLGHLAKYADSDGAKVMPCPDIGPAISELRLDGDEVVLLRSLALRDAGGRAISGLPTPGSANALTEPAVTLEGSLIPNDPSGADTEGITAGPDGTFIIGDEYGPSLLHVAADGRVLLRWVPEGLEPLFKGADYPVLGSLPAMAARRHLNRGFEGLTFSPDGTQLYLAFQSPLAHPGEHAHSQARHVRLWQLDAVTMRVSAQYIYPLDRPSSFRRDAERGEVDWSDIKVSELVMIDRERLLVLERASATTKLYQVQIDPAYALEPKHLEVATRPTIEELSARGDLEERVPVLKKALVMSTDDLTGLDADLEGMILLSPRTLLLVNDNDFGIEGTHTRFWRIDLPVDL